MLNANEIEVLEMLESCHSTEMKMDEWFKIFLDLEVRNYVTPYGDLTENGKTALAMWREV